MTTVITYGTFDLFHQGHYNLLKRAKELGDFLIVGVTGETYDVERGKLSVQDSLATRLENVKATGFADKIIVEEYLGQKIPDIIKYHVDIFAIGSDWKGKFDHIGKYCQIVYLERTKNISSTLLRESNMSIYNFGIVTDSLYDNETVIEPKIVSGIHVESVYSPKPDVAKQFSEIYELNAGFSNYKEFLQDTDIVYIKMPRNQRKEYVVEAIRNKKHVICDMPITMDAEEEQEILNYANRNGVSLFCNVMTLYQHAFGQLLWMARGNLIGDLVSIKCSISRSAFDKKCEFDFMDLAYYPICVITKIMGSEYDSVHSKLIKDGEEIAYGVITFDYQNAVAVAEVSMDLDVSGSMTIVGTNGEITIPEDWWRMGYFKLRNWSEPRAKHYSSNFEGNGFRYLIQAILSDIRMESSDTTRITLSEHRSITEILNMVQ